LYIICIRPLLIEVIGGYVAKRRCIESTFLILVCSPKEEEGTPFHSFSTLNSPVDIHHPSIMILFSILYSIFFFSSLICCFQCASSFATPPTHHIHNTYSSTKINNDLQDEIERKARQRAYEKRSQGGGTGETVGGAVSVVCCVIYISNTCAHYSHNIHINI